MRNFILVYMMMIVQAFSGDHDVSVSFKGTFTTGTRFTYNINKVNSYSEARTIMSNLGYGGDVRWNIFWDRFYLGVSAEKITGFENRSLLYPQYNYLTVPVEEGFEVLALELSGYFIVPISSERVLFYLGGGFGTYDGKMQYSIARVGAETITSQSYIGIHVLTGIDYRLTSRFGLRFELKFRDPHFDVTTKFDKTSVEYEGRIISLPQSEDVTKVNLFGVNYMGGIIISL